MDSVLFSLCFFQNLPLAFGKNTRLQRPIARIFPRSSPPSQTFAPRLPPRLPIDPLLRRLVRAPDYPAIPPFSPGSAARSSCGGTPRRRTDRRSHQSSPVPPPPAPHGTGPMGAPFLFIQTAEVNSAVCKVLSPTKRLYGASAPPHLRWGPTARRRRSSVARSSCGDMSGHRTNRRSHQSGPAPPPPRRR